MASGDGQKPSELLSKFISCDPSAAGCLDQTIEIFGRNAFRRPLTDAEVARFFQLIRAPSFRERMRTTP